MRSDAQVFLRRPSVREIKLTACRIYGITLEELDSPLRNFTIARARHVSMYVARRRTMMSGPALAREFHREDHTTVIHALKKVEADDELLHEAATLSAAVDEAPATMQDPRIEHRDTGIEKWEPGKLTAQEQACFDILLGWIGAFRALPTAHPADWAELVPHIHALQEKIMVRPTLRSDPAVWRMTDEFRKAYGLPMAIQKVNESE